MGFNPSDPNVYRSPLAQTTDEYKYRRMEADTALGNWLRQYLVAPSGDTRSNMVAPPPRPLAPDPMGLHQIPGWGVQPQIYPRQWWEK